MTHPWQLHYDTPAVRWTEALPLGNGRIGVAVFSPKLGQFTTLFSNITQSKKLELNLRSSEKRLRTLTAATARFR